MYLCVRGVDFIEVSLPRQKSERSCTCVLEVLILLKCLYQGRKVSSHVFVCRGVDFIEVPVPRQESEQSSICVLEVSIVLKCLYQGRKVSSHVFVC
jgi:hypothetical protein